MAIAAAGTSTMMPSGGGPPQRPRPAALRRLLAASAAPRRARPVVVTIGSMTLERAERGRSRQRAQLDPEHVRMPQRQAHAAHAEEGVALASDRVARDRLVAAGIQGSDGDGTPGRPRDEVAIERELAFLIPQCTIRHQELGPHQADSVAAGRDPARQRRTARPR